MNSLLCESVFFINSHLNTLFSESTKEALFPFVKIVFSLYNLFIF